ncbi:MAG: GNAT family N-acetyltransferase [Deltaproteobacteria bacterium]|nr:GNAT family N-acetyltransferase [Deltaproteobacteria bacterium]
MAGVEVRNAKETDASFIAWVELTATRSHLPRGFYDFAFPGDEAECLERIRSVACTRALSMAHWSNFLVAEVDGQLASGLSGYEPTKRGPDTMPVAMMEALGGAGWTEEHIGEVFNRMTPFLTCVTESPEDAWVVEWVATKPEYRGHGLIRRLLTDILDEGRRRGYRRSQISVLIGNTPAQRAYEGAGFKVEDEKRHPEFERVFGCPGIRRMLRSL